MDSAPSSAATTRSDGCFILFSDVNEECRLSGSLPSSTGDWIESGHLCGDAGGVLAKVLLLHLAIVAHGEGHHAAITIHVRYATIAKPASRRPLMSIATNSCRAQRGALQALDGQVSEAWALKVANQRRTSVDFGVVFADPLWSPKALAVASTRLAL